MAEGKKYGGMEAPAVLKNHYGSYVFVNKKMDELRRTECLCYNCANLNFHRPDNENCPIAGAFYKICQITNVALAVTRCPKFIFEEK